MPTVNVTLDEILAARDARATTQMRLLSRYQRPLISFTMNIAGPVKQTPLTDFAFDAGLARLLQALGEPISQEIIRPHTGCEARLVYDHPAAELKALCLALESEKPVGRLYDLDVLDIDGEKLSRPTPRACLICGAPVTACSRSRAHGLDAIVEKTNAILRDFAAEQLSAMAENALLTEVELTPKPGLVDQRNNGAHDDMDLPLFRRSAAALRPVFRSMVLAGMDGASAAELQALGLQGEQAMFAATGGVNTHKGALYSFSLLLAAISSRLVRGGDVFETAAAFAAQLLSPDGTHGSAVKERYQVGGVRAEALAAFPTARYAAEMLQSQDPLSVLLWLMANTQDSNLYYRGGAEGAAFVRQTAAQILTAPTEQRIALLEAMDDAMIEQHLSPGGCADLLALALFLQELSRYHIGI